MERMPIWQIALRRLEMPVQRFLALYVAPVAVVTFFAYMGRPFIHNPPQFCRQQSFVLRKERVFAIALVQRHLMHQSTLLLDGQEF